MKNLNAFKVFEMKGLIGNIGCLAQKLNMGSNRFPQERSSNRIERVIPGRNPPPGYYVV